MRIFGFLGLLLCLPWVPLFAEFETFTNDAGQSIEAELIELKRNGEVVVIRLRSGNKMDAELSAFSRKDQQKIKGWWRDLQADKQLLRADSKLDISAKMNRKSRKNNDYYWRDDKTEKFFPEVIIQNDELETFKGNTVHVLVVAKDLRNQDQRLIVSASKLQTDLNYRGKTFLESEPFRLRKYEYDSSSSSNGYAYGYEYEGYVVVVKNSKGEITHTRATKSKYLSDMQLILKCQAGEMYDESLSRKLNVRPSSYFVQ